jgi:hypothetical protein
MVWLNDNVIVRTCVGGVYSLNPLTNRLVRNTRFRDSRQRAFALTFDDESFAVVCLNEPTVTDKAIIESQVQRQIHRLEIHSACAFYDFHEPAETTVPMLFTYDAWREFTAGNQQLRVLSLHYITISNDACDIVGNIPHLDTLHLYHCVLDLQRFVGLLQTNVFGQVTFA